MVEQHGYWIHHKIDAPDSVIGYFYSRECVCSVCGSELNMEKEKCPYCGAIMDRPTKNDEDEKK